MAIGFWRSWALVVGMMIGSGIFTLPAVLAPYGSYSFVAWGITALGALCLVFCLSYLAARTPVLIGPQSAGPQSAGPRSGGPQVYVFEAFGQIPAILVAWCYWISVLVAVAGIALSFAGYLTVFFPLINSSPLFNALVALAVVWCFTAISLRGTEQASIVQLVTSLLKIVPLIVIGVAGLAMGNVGSIPANNPTGEGLPVMIAGIMLLIMWSYIGIESATVPAEDTIEPQKTIPRALLAGTLTATAVYMLALAGVMALLPAQVLVNSTYPFSAAARLLFGSAGGWLVAVGALISIGGALNACVFLSGVVPHAGAKEGLFPRWLGKGRADGTGTRAILFSSALASVLILSNSSKGLLKSYEFMILISTFSVLIAYLGVALASLRLQFLDRQQGRDFYLIRFLISILATLFSVFALVGAWSLYQ
jgi:APA family basic amino acid/polyamine antiporter